MTLSKTITKAEKITGQKGSTNGQIFYFPYKGYTISFCANGRAEDDKDAIAFYTSNKSRTEDDRNSDYFPGTFHDNLSQAIKFIDRRSN
jgi:hypothetical protein